jgi:phosphomannomutase
LMAGDFRTSTPDLRKALADGLLNSGAHVLDSGQIPTPIAYFAHQRWKTDAVMILTASHNPAEHNGLKLMLGSLPPTRADFERLRHDAERGRFRNLKGALESVDPIPAYHDWLMARWGKLRGTPVMSVVLDAGSGAWSALAPRWFEELGFRVHKLFCEVDGKFPHRSPDCARPASLAGLMQEVVDSGAELGIAWDGDGDRVAFVDGRGSIVSTDEISSLIAQSLVSQERGSKVVYDIKLSDLVRQTVERAGGRAIMERSGHAFIKRTMIEQDALFGCEASGHYFFRELHGGDDGLFAALMMTDLLKRRGVRLADLRRSLPPIYVTPDLRIPAEILSFAEITRRLRAAFNSARETSVDGIRLETSLGSVLARESVTEPVVTMRLEGSSEKSLRRLIAACLEALSEVSQEIAGQIH